MNLCGMRSATRCRDFELVRPILLAMNHANKRKDHLATSLSPKQLPSDQHASAPARTRGSSCDANLPSSSFSRAQVLVGLTPESVVDVALNCLALTAAQIRSELLELARLIAKSPRRVLGIGTCNGRTLLIFAQLALKQRSSRWIF